MPIRERNLSPSLAAKIAQMGLFVSPNANHIYVDSGHAATGTGKPGSTPRNPLSTIQGALTASDTAVTASNGDVIWVMPGHTEDIGDATTLAPAIVGVNIIGLGRGSDRPTLTFTAAGGTVAISAANVVMSNFLFKIADGPIDVAKGITVTAADVLLDSLEFTEQDLAQTDEQFVAAISLDAGSDRAHVRGLKFLGSTGDGSDGAIEITAVVTGVVIEDPFIIGDFADGCINIAAAALENLIIRPVLEQRHASVEECIVADGSATGFILHPRLRGALNTADGFDNTITAAAMQSYDLQIVNNAGETSQVGAHAALDVSGNLMAARVVSTAE